MKKLNWQHSASQCKQGTSFSLLFAMTIGFVAIEQNAIAQETTQPMTISIALVETAGASPDVRTVPGYAPRFSDVVGSGALILNADNQVTGYYFTIGELQSGTPYAYHFHAARNSSGTLTSCEGDKALVSAEAAGGVITNLSAIAPIQPSSGGVAFVGSSLNPIELPTPVPLSEIGYLNIHPAPGGQVGPGVICANVRLNPGGFVR